MDINQFAEHVETLAKKARRRIGVVLQDPSPAIVRSLELAQRQYADLVIVGVPLEGFATVQPSDQPEHTLVDLLVDGKVEGIIRGQTDYTTVRDYLAAKESDLKEEDIVTPAVLQDAHERTFVLTLCNDFEGHTIANKAITAIHTAEWLRGWGIEPKVAVMSALFSGLAGREKILDRTREEAEIVVQRLQSGNISASVSEARIDQAIASGHNVIMPVNGIVGHQIYRALCLLGSGKLIASPILGFKHVVVDGSRYEEDWTHHVRFATAWCNTQ